MDGYRGAKISFIEEFFELYAAGRRDFSGLSFSYIYGDYSLLEGADLSGINLAGANLAQCGFIGTNLSNAFLVGIDVSEGFLDDCNLSRADLRGANLIKARLYRTDLRRADLSYANLTRANLAGSIGPAILNHTNLAEADLRNSVGFMHKNGLELRQDRHSDIGTFFWNTIMPDGSIETGPVYIADWI
ncbi:MAG: pentapeptide repeat-containing protein [Nostoc sp. NOS(2021)]|uniref:pentapeptide repeat-containing protein n=1 Tax=Nostoc sp. NOS(2021) TaxID=2815407 RepID=UPI0025D09D8A|nr:pentapeptide repeat-containing protein [Nostoc sp. NOS(2021)]MBN3893954.1 pentapeptide repeat-containing protein [Nostoc sp. NOS(2021)]